MAEDTNHTIHDLAEYRQRTRVFRTREEGGMVLARMLRDDAIGPATVLGIPAGGVPVAAAIADELDLPLDVAVVSKVTLPWNTEAGYGAVAFDGTVKLNEAMLQRLGLSEQQVKRGIAETSEKVQRRVEKLRGDSDYSNLRGRRALLVDDGLASGFTLLTAVEAVRNQDVGRIIVAIPTGQADGVGDLAGHVHAVYCPNMRGGLRFAVADAYEHWYDVSEGEVAGILAEHRED